MSFTAVLVDTSVWIEAFRRKDAGVVSLLTDLLGQQRAVTVGQVMAEVLYGCRHDKEREKVKEAFEALPFIDTTRSDWIQAGDLGASLRRRGTTVPLSDLVIAAVALREGFPVFSLDKHFDVIPNLPIFPTSK